MKSAPDIHDAELILKLYDLRREPVMRESRDAMLGKFWPKSYEEFVAVTQPDNPLNRAFRQVSSYWEMAYAFARHGIIQADFLAETAGEGLFFFAKVEPYLERFRTESGSPTSFQNAEWIAKNCEFGKSRLQLFRKRVQQMTGGK